MSIKSARKAIKIKALLILLAAYVLFQTGCAPTYPKEIVDEAVKQLCKTEYGIDVDVELAGNTMAVYLPIENLLQQALGISEEARDKINDVVLSVSRVTLSTDAPIQFYIIIAQDPVFSEVEVVIIRYVNDIKMFHYTQISRGEFANRAIIELKLTPQAQKEQILKTIFEQLGVGEDTTLLDEFLAKDVSTIGDIGYWNNQFFIKEISLEEFLAIQIAKRAERSFMVDEAVQDKFKVNFIKGAFSNDVGVKSFRFDMEVVPKNLETFFMTTEDQDRIFTTVLDAAALVLNGYKFNDFHAVRLHDEISGESLTIGSTELEDFRKKKIDVGDLRWRN